MDAVRKPLHRLHRSDRCPIHRRREAIFAESGDPHNGTAIGPRRLENNARFGRKAAQLTTYQPVGIIAVMPKSSGENARDKLVGVGTDLLRRNGYTATTVDEICSAAGLTKGASSITSLRRKRSRPNVSTSGPRRSHRSTARPPTNRSSTPSRKCSPRSTSSSKSSRTPTFTSRASRAPWCKKFPKRTLSSATRPKPASSKDRRISSRCSTKRVGRQANPRHRLTCRILDEHDARLAASDKGLAQFQT